MLLALGLGSSQSRFPASRWLNSRMESIGLLHMSDGINVDMWRLATVGTDVEINVLLYSALIGA